MNETAPPTQETATKAEPRGGANRTAEITAFVALLVLTFLLGGALAQAREDAVSVMEPLPTERSAGAGASSPQAADVPTARPHPRGLPRRDVRLRARTHRGLFPAASRPPEEAGPGGEPGFRGRPGGVKA